MDIDITFRHSDTSQALKVHVEEKIRKLSKYFLKAVHAHVVLNVERSLHSAEITLSEQAHQLCAKASSHDMYRSIDDALDKLESQLRKTKERAKSHHG